MDGASNCGTDPRLVSTGSEEWGWRNPSVEWRGNEEDLKFGGIYLGWGVRTDEVVRRGRRRRRWIGSRRPAPFRFYRPCMFAGFEIGCAAATLPGGKQVVRLVLTVGRARTQFGPISASIPE